MGVDMCVDMCRGVCVDMCRDMCVDMCRDMCRDMFGPHRPELIGAHVETVVCRDAVGDGLLLRPWPVCRHVYRYVHRHV